jgi:hypothetical protein
VLAASSGLAPWSMAVDRTGDTAKNYKIAMGIKGACSLGLPPPLGREGVILASSSACKTAKNFNRTRFFYFSWFGGEPDQFMTVSTEQFFRRPKTEKTAK